MRRVVARQVYIFNIVSYVLLVGTLIAVATVYLYGRYTQNALATAIVDYNTAIAGFDQTALDEVIEFDERLRHTTELIGGAPAITAALAVVESATIDTVQFIDLTLTYTGQNELKLVATIKTDTFDSVLFQRQMYESSEQIKTVKLEEVAIEFIQPDEEENTRGGTTVGFTATFTIDGEALTATSTAPIVPTTTPTVGRPTTAPPADIATSS